MGAMYLGDGVDDDGTMWFAGKNKLDPVVAKYDGAFTVYSRTDMPGIDYTISVIPVPGWEGLFFGSYPSGYVEYSAGQWQKRWIEIERNGDDILLGNASLLASDGKGGVWAAADSGVSHFKDGTFTNYQSEDENVWNIKAIAAGADDTIYAASNQDIIRISPDNISYILYPLELDLTEGWPVLGSDDNGRLWLAENPCAEGCAGGRIFYYDGEWHNLVDADGNNFIIWANKIIADGSGGVWIAAKSETELTTSRLIHVKNDLSIQGYTPANSELAYDVVEDIYLDARGVLWILSKQKSQPTDVMRLNVTEIFAYYGAEAVQTLQNDIFTTKAISDYGQTTIGYPTGGIWGIAEAGGGNVVFAGRDNTNDTFLLYSLSGEELVADDNVFYTPYSYEYSDYYSQHVQHIVGSNGIIYAIGDIYYSGDHDLVQIGDGIGKETVWSEEYPIDINAGAAHNLDLLPGKTLTVGNYILSTELISILDQKLAASDYGFVVRDSAVAASIIKSGAADPNVRAGMDQEIIFEVLNNTAEAKPDLALTVKKLSPSGVETILQEGPLSLSAGESHNGTLTFNESEIGVWQLNVEVRENDTLLDSAELILKNSEPVVTYEIIYPEYAGDEAFPVKVKLANMGMIATNVHILVGANNDSPLPDFIDEDVALNPGEERILSFTDTITVDRVYDIVFTGDLETSEQKTVAYGYVGNLALTILPQNREGMVTMGYTVANAGGLPFGDTIHFELFAVGNAVALYTVDKTYNLYPGAEPFIDALEFPLVPGAYQLRWTSARSGSGQAEFSILPAGIGQLAFAPALKYA
ncbi:MAG: hypothetical protein E4H46_01320, partial [Desulfobacterales bacterium]